jgi:uncharacterized protein DUF3892
MAHLEVTCIRKRSDHDNPRERVQGLGGSGWFKTEDEVIREIERGTNSYWVAVHGRPVQVAVATHQRRKYLKTAADGYVLNNLLALPECQGLQR